MVKAVGSGLILKDSGIFITFSDLIDADG